MKRCIQTAIILMWTLSSCMQTFTFAQRRLPAGDRSQSEFSPLVPRSTDFFPLEVGNEWEYSDGTNSFAVQVLRETQEANGLKYFEVSGYFPGDPAGVRKIRHGLSGIVEYNPNGQDLLWYRFASSPDSWRLETSTDVSCVNGSLVTPDSSIQPVTVPAGTFERTVHFNLMPPCMDAGITGESFAANIGLVQRVLTTFAGPRTYNLVSAHVGLLELPKALFGVQVTMDRPVYYNNLMPIVVDPSPTAHVMLVVRNDTDIPVEFSFPTSQRFDFIVRDAHGQEVLRWSDGRAFSQILGRETLVAGSRRYPADIKLKTHDGKLLPAGSYTLAGFLTLQNDLSPLGTIPFEVRDVH